MPLLVNSVPNLAQGVSQQPDNLRYPGQCDEQVNAWATVVEGLVKRPHTSYIKNVDSSQPSNLFTHFVKRDEKNKYVINVSLGGSVSAYNLSLGTSIPVVTTSIAQSYLSGITNPAKDIRALTVADYTFLVNKKKQVAVNTNEDTLSDDIRNSKGKYDALVFVKLGDYEKTYNIYLDGREVPFGGSGLTSNKTPPAGHTYESGSSAHGVHADTEVIAEDLEIILKAYIGGGSDGKVNSVTLSGGSGFEDSGETAVRKISYEFFIEQFNTAVPPTKIGYGAKGTAVFKNGTIQSHTLTQGGTGYDGGLPDNTYKLTIRKHEEKYVYKTKLGSKGPSAVYRAGSSSDKTDIVSTTPGYVLPSFTVSATPAGGTNYTVERGGSIIKITGETDFSIRTEDGLANQGLGVAYKEVASITDLPQRCFNDFRIKVRGDADIAQDDYFVQFQTKDKEDYGEGSWLEIVGWEGDVRSAGEIKGIATALNYRTMPVTVVPKFNADGSVARFIAQTPNEMANMVEHNGVVYNLLEGHTSSSDNEPGGTVDTNGDGIYDWEKYWVVNTRYTTVLRGWVTDEKYFERSVSYDSRGAGDDFTNPFPSFVGQTINDIFFFKNRLGILTNNAVIFSEADAYFNFFRTTTQQLLDSAPIDVGLSHTKVAVLQHAIPFQEKLMLFSKQSQFVLRGADILSPKTVAISPVTEYDISDSINPLAVGNYIYFTFQRNDYEGVYEYFVDNNTETFNAEEITQQIPKYISKKATRIVGSPTENTLVITTDADPKTLFVYKYFWSNKEKIQSAWMKFTFERDIVGCDFIDSKLFMLTSDTEGLHLESLTLEDGLKDTGLDYSLYLDSRVDGKDVTVAAYDTTAKTTRISNIPYDTADLELYTKIGTQRSITIVNNTTIDVTGSLASYVSNGGTVYECVHTDADTQAHVSTAATEPGTGASWTDYWVVSTDFSSATAWALGQTYYDNTYFFIGKPYNMLYRFSNQSLKQPTERGGRSASDYTFQTIRNGSLNYADTGHFTVEVTPLYRDTYKYVFNPDIVGANLSLNEFKPQDGHFRFAVQAQPDEVTIEVKSDSALPVKLLAAEFESMFIPRSRRYGS